MKRFMTAAVLAVALVGSLLAVPAAAGPTGVGVLVGGEADVGEVATCTKDPGTMTIPTGDGIFLPGLRPPNDPKDKKYRIQADLVAVGSDNDNDWQVSDVELNVCGNVTGVGNFNDVNDNQFVRDGQIGPYCGMSKGYNGKGQAKFTSIVKDGGLMPDVDWINIYDLGWKFSAGTVLPLIGKYEEANETGDGPTDPKGAKKNKWGQIIGAVSARSLPGQTDAGQSCIDTATTPAGGTNFNVDGVIALLRAPGNAKKNDVPLRWNDDWREGLPGQKPEDKDHNDSPIFCKGSYDADNNGSKESKCPYYKTKPKSKPKTG